MLIKASNDLQRYLLPTLFLLPNDNCLYVFTCFNCSQAAIFYRVRRVSILARTTSIEARMKLFRKPQPTPFDAVRFTTSWLVGPAILFILRAIMSLYCFATLYAVLGHDNANSPSSARHEFVCMVAIQMSTPPQLFFPRLPGRH